MIGIDLLEEYVLTENKEEFFKKLIKGSVEHSALTLLHEMNKHGLDLPPEQKSALAKAKGNNDYFFMLREALLRLAHQGDPRARTEACEFLANSFNFSYGFERPLKITGEGNQNVEKIVTYDSELRPDEVTVEVALAKLQTDSIVQDSQCVDFNKLGEQYLKQYLDNVNVLTTSRQGFVPFYIKYLKEHPFHTPNAAALRCLTLSQLEEVMAAVPPFAEMQQTCAALFAKTFWAELQPERTEPSRAEQIHRRIADLDRMRAWAMRRPRHQSLADELLLEMLHLGPRVGAFDMARYEEYLRRTPFAASVFSPAQQTRQCELQRGYTQAWRVVHRLPCAAWKTQEALHEDYLEAHFRAHDCLAPFDGYFRQDFLFQKHLRSRLMRGQEVPGLAEFLTTAELGELKQRRLLTLAPGNQLRFEVGEAVALSLETKNVPHLQVLVYELDMLNYYKRHLRELDEHLRLDGLLPSELQEFSYPEPPVVLATRQFRFDKLTGRRGVFVVEFVGAGLITRAVIRLGKLIVRERTTVAGHVFEVFDERMQPCRQEVGLFLDRTLYRGDSRGEVLIPFRKNALSAKAIAFTKDAAVLFDTTIAAESYQLECHYLTARESALLNSTARILARPRLFLNGCLCPFSLVESARAEIVTVNEPKVTSTKAFDGLKLHKDRDLVFDFEVGAKIIQARLTFKVELKNLDKQKVELQSNYTVRFDSMRGRSILATQFLRRNNEGYFIELLGKNGEPKKGFIANLSFSLNNFHRNVEKILQTNAEGRIKLGPLTGVRRVASSITPQGDISVEKLNVDLTELSQTPIQNFLQVISGQNITLPLPLSSSPKVKLFRVTSDGLFIEQLSEKLMLGNGQIKIDSLPVGTYAVVYQNLQQTQIVVLSGQRTNKNLILTPDRLITPAQVNQLFNVIDCAVSKATSGKGLVFKAKLIGDPSKVRAHIFLSHFYDRNNYRPFVWGMGKNATSSSVPILTSGNTYLSNKPMGDELKYVLERKNKTIYIGNTLEKPALLLKREFVKDTVTRNEDVSGEGNFSRTETSAKPCAFAKEGSMLKQVRPENAITICKMQDFLALPGRILDNLVPSEAGLFEVPVPEGYSSLTAVFIHESNDIIGRELGLPTAAVPVRDLRHREFLKVGQYYTLQRTRTTLRAGEKYQCADVTSTELRIIDSFGKLFAVLQSLCKTQNLPVQELDKLAFLRGWLALPVEEKNEKYDEFCSHELNAFLFFNDPPYFEKEVAPFLRSKVAKTFMDHVLLEDEPRIMPFVSPVLLHSLCLFEQVCLIYYLVNHKHGQLAEQVACVIEMRARISKVDKKHFKNLFDTVLNASELKNFKAEAQEMDDCFSGGGGGAMCFQSMPLQQVRQVQQPMFYQSQSFTPDLLMMNQCNDEVQFDCFNYVDAKCASQNQYFQMEIQDEPRYMEMRQSGSLMRGFSQLEKTKEYREKQWLFEAQDLNYFSQFYAELARHLVNRKTSADFLSQEFLLAQNLRDVMAVLTFMDLGEQACGPQETKDKGIVIGLTGNAIAFQKELKETHEQAAAVTVFQKFFDSSQRTFQDEEGNWAEQAVEEFLVDRVYGCQVIVTNSTINPLELDVLAEIPRGAMPVSTTEYTKSQNMVVPSYTTESFEYCFYFPAPGDFDIYPANAARHGRIAATAAPRAFPVRRQRTEAALKTMSDILQKGTQKDILEFVATRNLLNPQVFSFPDIYYLLKDKSFYEQVIAILRRRRIYDRQVWSFAYFHQDLPAIREHLASPEARQFLKKNLLYFKSEMVEFSHFELREYLPLVNQRAHPLKERLNILNAEFKSSYREFLQYLREKPCPSGDDRLVLVYFLNLQDRVGEACAVLQQVDPATVSCELQYDYFRAYFDFYIDYPNFKTARALTDKYLTYPVIAWRNLFYDVANQLAEFDGEQPEFKTRKKEEAKAEKAEFLEAVAKGTALQVTFKNVGQLRVLYYRVDLELIFSRNPLISSGKEDFSFVKASREEVLEVACEDKLVTRSWAVPTELAQQNCYVVVQSSHRQCALTYFSSALRVAIDEDLGQLKVLSPSDRPLAKVYVKVIGEEHGGAFVFFKDGYTDLRGQFDYVTRSQGSLANITKFALFVLSEEHGSVIKQANKPSGMDAFEARVSLISHGLKNEAQNRFNKVETSHQECYMQQKHWKR